MNPTSLCSLALASRTLDGAIYTALAATHDTACSAAAATGSRYTVDVARGPRTGRLRGKSRRGRPMSMQTSGQGFVSKAEKTEMGAYCMKTNANQQASATFRPQQTLSGFVRAISTARV